MIAISAGNHAQGVALHAGRLGIPATIVMPIGTPMTKIQRTEALGATVVRFGESYSEAEEFALDFGAQKGLTLVHPFDDPLVIAGVITSYSIHYTKLYDNKFLEVPDFAEILVDGCEPDVRHRIEGEQRLHHHFADLIGRHLGLARGLQTPLDRGDDALDALRIDGA